MFGIEPTHREELRKKQGIRLVLEEVLIDTVEILVLVGHKTCDIADSSYSLIKTGKKFVLSRKSHLMIAIIALVALSAMVL